MFLMQVYAQEWLKKELFKGKDIKKISDVELGNHFIFADTILEIIKQEAIRRSVLIGKEKSHDNRRRRNVASTNE